MTDDDEKKYPPMTDGVRNLLNNKNEQADEDSGPQAQSTGQAPANLPMLDFLPAEVIEELEKPVKTVHTQPEVPKKVQHPLGAPAPSGATGPLDQITEPAKKKGNEIYAMILSFFIKVLPYVVIFAIGLGLYFFYFSDFSFHSLINPDRLNIQDIAQRNKDRNIEALQKQEAENYQRWVGQFFFSVNDPDIISVDTDVSGNGLSNFEKYLLNLNPKVFSTRGGMGDGELVIDGMNPWTGKPFTDEQKALIEKYINTEVVSNRITAAAITRGVTKFAQYVNPDSPYYIDPVTFEQLQRDNPIITSPNTPVTTIPSNTPRPGTNPTPVTPINTGSDINQSIAGKLEIPSVKISVPLIWTQEIKNIDKDLDSGVVHYPGTVLPGQIGTSYISGHSSGYLWNRSPYKSVFAILGQVKDGTSFTITATLKDGKTVTYHYVVERRAEYKANDQAQFVNTADSVVALSTCWPVGTIDRRLVVFGKLTQTER